MPLSDAAIMTENAEEIALERLLRELAPQVLAQQSGVFMTSRRPRMRFRKR